MHSCTLSLTYQYVPRSLPRPTRTHPNSFLPKHYPLPPLPIPFYHFCNAQLCNKPYFFETIIILMFIKNFSVLKLIFITHLKFFFMLSKIKN